MYLKKDVRTETRRVAESEITLPVFHICPSFSHQNLECYKNKTIHKHRVKSHCHNSRKPKLHCLKYFSTKQSVAVSCGEKELIPTCVSANADGSLKTTATSSINIFVASDKVEVFLDTQEVAKSAKEVMLENPLDLHGDSGEYYISMQKRITERMPSPYPSNCSDGEGIDNFFTKSYSREACMQTCFLKRLFYNCGSVYDRWQKFVTPDLEVDPNINSSMSDTEVSNCLKNYTEEATLTATKCGCPLACNETKISMQMSYTERHYGGYDLFVKYNPFEVTHVREIPEYPIEQFVADIGGLAGLVAGMSVISILEIIICAILTLFIKFRCLK